MFKKFAHVWTLMVAMFAVGGKEESLLDNGELNLSEKQKEQLQAALGPTVKLEKVVAAMNAELAEINNTDTEAKDQQLVDLREKALKMLKEHEFTDAEAQKLIDNPAAAEGKTEKQLLSSLVTAMEEQKAQAKEQDKKIAKLLASAEDDSPLQIIRNTANAVMQHSQTHLLSSGKEYDAFAGRPWNQLAAGQTTQMPSFSAIDSPEVQQLKDDMDLFHREVDAELKTLFRDQLGLPSFWRMRSNVDDRVADGNVVVAEITQARKKGWLPKNRELIQPEEGRVFPAQVDIEYSGYWLQTQLTSWIHQYNKEGSQAYKWSFVKFLLVELNKRARQEDRKVAVNGVYVPTPAGTEVPGLAIHRGDGVNIQLWRAFFLKKQFKSATMGKPTQNNIVDYVKEMIEKNVPLEERNSGGLIFYLPPFWMKRYVERKRILFGLDNNYTGKELTQVELYPNIQFCEIVDWEGTDFMMITYDNNIELMENVPGERSLYRFEQFLRNMYIFGDYKWGSRILHIGTKVKDTDPLAFKVQTVWTNGMPMFRDDFFVRLYDNGTDEVSLPFSNITVTSDYVSEIKTLTNTFEGQIVRIQGTTGVAASAKVVSGGNITLAGGAAFLLNTGGVLTLRVGANGALTEIKRTVTPPVAPSTDITFTGTTIDANEGSTFLYAGAAATLTAIDGGFDTQQIVIHGGANGALTLADVAGKIDVEAGSVLADAEDNITLANIDGVWTEVARTIAED